MKRVARTAVLCAAVVAAQPAFSQGDKQYTFTPDAKNWTKVDMPDDMRTIEGSALDLSRFIDTPTSPNGGRVIVSRKGTLAFEDNPEKSVRFKGFTLFSHYLLLIPDIEEMKVAATEYAKLIRRNGYNFIRPSFDFFKTYKFRPRKDDIFDRIDFFFAELKKNGIYVHLPLMWYDSGEKDYVWELHDDVKQRTIFGDPAAWEAWKRGTEEQLNHVNPYTGLAWKDDPMFAIVEYYNELSIDVWRNGINATEKNQQWIKSMYVDWLKARYQTIDKLNESWNRKGFSRKPCAYKNFDEIKSDFQKNPDWGVFAFEKMRKFLDFASSVVDGTGYKGLRTQMNLTSSPQSNDARSQYADVVIKNNYFSHPSNFQLDNVSCTQNSSFESSSYWQSMAGSRLNDRPMGITEYQHCFWNKYRYEAPAFIPAYSAFQGLSYIIVHEDVVVNSRKNTDKKSRKLTPFQVAFSPIGRAAEVFSSAMFMRGDVKVSRRRVDLVFPRGYLDKDFNATRQINADQTRISFLTGFATEVDTPKRAAIKKAKIRKADMQIQPAGYSELRAEAWFQEVTGSPEYSGFDISKFVQELKKRGILPADNISDPSAGVYQSDTGQLTLNAREKWMKIITPRTELVSMEIPAPVALESLRVVSVSTSSTVGVCSLEKTPISESRRLMLVFATQEANTGMLATADLKDAKTLGSAPALMFNGVLKAELRLDASKKFSVYPLALNGLRRKALASEFSDGVLKINIDTSQLPDGATTMYEIVAE